MDLLIAAEPGFPDSDGIARSITFHDFVARYRRANEAFAAGIISLSHDCVIEFQDEHGYAHIVRPFDEQWCEHHYNEMRGDARQLEEFRKRPPLASPDDPVWRVPLKVMVDLECYLYVPGDEDDETGVMKRVNDELRTTAALSGDELEEHPLIEMIGRRSIDENSEWVGESLNELPAGHIEVGRLCEVEQVETPPDIDFSATELQEEDEG